MGYYRSRDKHVDALPIVFEHGSSTLPSSTSRKPLEIMKILYVMSMISCLIISALNVFWAVAEAQENVLTCVALLMLSVVLLFGARAGYLGYLEEDQN